MNILRRMEIFVAIVEAGQFTRAADTIGLSKSAVSHAVNDLEAHLGVQLLIRTNRDVAVTPIGQTYFEGSRKILSDINILEEQARSAAGAVSGDIRLTAPITFGTQSLAPIIAEFTKAYPDIQIDVDLSEGKVDIVRERIDFAIRITEKLNQDLVARRITLVKKYLCASPEFAAAHKEVKDLDGLAKLNCLKYEGTPVWPLVKAGTEYVFQPQGTVVSNNGEAIRELVIAGHGVAFLPDFLFEPAHAKGTLAEFMPEYSGRPIGVYAVYQPGRRPKHVQMLIDFICERLAE